MKDYIKNLKSWEFLQEYWPNRLQTPINHTCLTCLASSLFFLLPQHSNWNPIIYHPIPRILQQLRKSSLLIPYRDQRLISFRVSLNSTQNFRHCHEICVCTKLYAAVIELHVSSMENLESMAWQTGREFWDPSDTVRNTEMLFLGF